MFSSLVSNRFLHTFLAASIVGVMAACQPESYVLQPAPQSDVESRFFEGDRVLVSEKDDSVVGLMNSATGDELRLTLFFVNGLDRSVNVGPGSVEVYLSNMGQTEKIAVVTPSQVLREKRKEQARRRAAFAFAAALEGASEASNPVASELNEQQTGNQARRMSRQQRSAYSSLEDLLLQRHTLQPGKQIAGDIYVRDPALSKDMVPNVHVRVPFGPNEHVFKLRSGAK